MQSLGNTRLRLVNDPAQFSGRLRRALVLDGPDRPPDRQPRKAPEARPSKQSDPFRRDQEMPTATQLPSITGTPQHDRIPQGRHRKEEEATDKQRLLRRLLH